MNQKSSVIILDRISIGIVLLVINVKHEIQIN